MSATYLYAIARSDAAGALPGLPGVGGAAVRALHDGELICAVSDVDLDEFGEDALRRNLEDLGWLERIAREHDAVVRALAEQAATVPLRMATICRDDGSARDRLHAMRDGAEAVLAVLDGREEWGVKLYGSDRAPEPAVAARPASGTDYLRQRQQELADRTSAQDDAARDAEQVYGRLGAFAARRCQHRPQDARLSGIAAPMVLNAAFLVDRERVAAFRAEAEELASQRPPDTLVVTGPWPAYSFVELEDG
jgi:Gas vesicle synthesis protein GvpL/GvpF.